MEGVGGRDPPITADMRFTLGRGAGGLAAKWLDGEGINGTGAMVAGDVTTDILRRVGDGTCVDALLGPCWLLEV